MFSFLNNIQTVTKNILLLNIGFFIVKSFYLSKGVDLDRILGVYYFNSPLFEPFQIITHFFMHGDFQHIAMNMLILVVCGSFLENFWGPKRFFFFYLISALGAILLYNCIGIYQIYELKQHLAQHIDANALGELDYYIGSSFSPEKTFNYLEDFCITNNIQNPYTIKNIVSYFSFCSTPMIGASGAIFGIMAAFAIQFANTEFQLFFGPPIKAKYIVGAYFAYELYQSFHGHSGDHVAHLAHVGGAIAGAIAIYIRRKTDKKNFW